MMAADNNPTLTQPLASTLAWSSRAGVLLDPQSVFGPNIGRYEPARTATQLSTPDNNNTGANIFSESESNPSIESYSPLPGFKGVLSSSSATDHLSVDMPMPVQIAQHDASFDQIEHYQAKEQSRLLDRFKLLKQWQHQQQEKLVRQQAEQLEMLRSEQTRVHQALLTQRQKQWGAGHVVQSPPRSPAHQSPTREMPVRLSPKQNGVRSGMSSVPQAIATGPLSLSQTARPMMLNSLLGSQGHQLQEVDFDDTTSEPNSSIVEEGVYPLPETGSEISDDIGGRHVEDQDTGMDADLEEEESLDTDEFTPEEGESAPMRRERSPGNHQQQMAMEDQQDDSLLGDDRPIQRGGGAKTFEELIEEQMRLEQQKEQQKSVSPSTQDQPSASAGRKTFLRRGQGTARFGKINIKPPKTKKKPQVKKKPEENASNVRTPYEDISTTTDTLKNAKAGNAAGFKPSGKAQSKLSPPPLSRKTAVIKQSGLSHLGVPPAKAKTKPLSRSAFDKEKLPTISMATVSQQPRDHYLPTEGVHPDDTIEMSFHLRMQDLQKKAEVEKDDLDEFELLEQAADDNASFSSNASLVVNMMKRTVVKRQNSLGALSEKSNSLQSSQEQPINLRSHDQSHDQSSSSESDNSDLDRTLKGESTSVPPPEERRVRKIGSSTEDDSDFGTINAANVVNSANYQTEKFHSYKEGNRILDVNQNANFNNSGSNYAALNDPGVLRLRLEQNESSEDEDQDEESDSESVTETDRNKHENPMDQSDIQEDVEEDGAKKSAAGTSSHALNVDFEDEESWGDFGNAISGDDDSDNDSIIAGLPVTTSTPPVSSIKGSNFLPLDRRKVDLQHDDQASQSPPTSKLVSKLFPKLKPVVPKQQQQQEKQQQESLQKATERPVGDGVQSKLLRDKLAELENEIDRFRKENALLAKLRDEREKNLSSLQKEIDEFHKQKTEELQRIQEFKEEEMKKLRREKKNFEKYQKAMKTMPDKKDRSEIELLKNQLSDLQEELNKRESRWQANSSRLRTRMEMVEKENKELGDEVEILQNEKDEIRKKEDKKAKSNAAKSRTRQLAELESARLASYPALPRVNVSTSSSDEEESRKEDRKESLAHKADSSDDEEIQIINEVQSAQLTRANGEVKGRVSKKRGAESVARMKSPPKPARVATLESHQPRNSSNQEDPSSQPRIQRKRSVHFDTSPNRVKPTSPVHVMQASPVSSSPSMPTWNLDHPAVSHDESMPSRRHDESKMKDDGDEEQIHHPDGKVEHIGPDGSRVITFSNGTRKEISTDGQSITVTFFNGDMKQIMADKRVVYYYSETGTTHTTYPDGLEILQFPNNQTEKHYPDGTKEITFPDHTIKYLFANGNEESVFADGTVLRVDKSGGKTMEFPNGQREIHTKQYKKREYPDGSVKTVYTDGRQETRYSNGRIRVKDKDGTVIVDKTC